MCLYSAKLVDPGHTVLFIGSTGTGVMLTPSTGINVVNKINLLRKSLLRYQHLNKVIKSKKMAFFDLYVTTYKTRKKRQKEGYFTTSVPVDPFYFQR